MIKTDEDGAEFELPQSVLEEKERFLKKTKTFVGKVKIQFYVTA